MCVKEKKRTKGLFVHRHGNGVIRTDFVYLDPRFVVLVSSKKRQKTYDRFELEHTSAAFTNTGHVELSGITFLHI